MFTLIVCVIVYVVTNVLYGLLSNASNTYWSKLKVVSVVGLIFAIVYTFAFLAIREGFEFFGIPR